MNPENKRFPFVPFLISVTIPLVASSISAYYKFNILQPWFESLNKPEFIKDHLNIGPYRIAVSITAGIASFIIWNKRKELNNYQRIINLYLFQLFGGVLISFLLFYFQNIEIGLIGMPIVVLFGIINTINFYKVSKLAAFFISLSGCWQIFVTYILFNINHLN